MVLGSQKASFNRERLEAIEVNLMLETAQLVANAALTRKESRGSHYMKDYPEQNDKEWLKNIVLSKGEDGGIKIKFSRLGVPANKT
jgi:succinate dehydrogenase/fumarate reductase flavoprotein subunit